MSNPNKEEAEFARLYGESLRRMAGEIQKDCPEAELLRRFFAGELEAEQEARIEQHLDLCPVCLEAMQRLALTEKEAGPETLPQNWSELAQEMDAAVYGKLQRTAAARKTDRERPTQRAGIFAPLQKLLHALPMPAYLPRAAAYAAVALSLFVGGVYSYALLSRPATFSLAQIQMQRPGVLRGGAGGSEDLREGLQLLQRGNYRRAAASLQRFVQRHPDHFHAHFYLGLAELLQAKKSLLGVDYQFDANRVRSGIQKLEKALSLAGDNPYYREDCLWYLGKAYLMLGEPEQARRRFEQLQKSPQPGLTRRAAAEQMLQKIERLMRKE